MKVKYIFLLLVFVFVLNSAYAGERQRPIQLQLMNSITGFGFHAGYHLNDKFYFGLENTSISFDSDDDGGADSDVEVKLDFSTSSILARYAPFAGIFYLQAGIVQRSWDVEAKGSEKIGDSGREAEVKADISFPSNAFSVGVGWNWIAKFGLSGGVGFGLINGGAPTVDSLTVNDNTISQSDINKEKEEFEDDLSKFKNFPYVNGFIGFNF
jgi:hypothetical protein